MDYSRSRHVGARGQQGHIVWVSVGQLQEAACLVRNEAVMHTNAAAADKLNVLLPQREARDFDCMIYRLGVDVVARLLSS